MRYDGVLEDLAIHCHYLVIISRNTLLGSQVRVLILAFILNNDNHLRKAIEQLFYNIFEQKAHSIV